MSAFSIQIPFNDPKAMEQFQEMMNKLQDAQIEYIQKVMNDCNITFECASDVVYLRSRSRWTQKLENELIELHKANNPPNICDWP